MAFFIDGAQNATISEPCDPGLPVASGGAGENTALIGRHRSAGSLVGDVRLYHRFVNASDIAIQRNNRP